MQKLIIHHDGDRWWLLDGELHREGGPAVESKYGTKEWCRDGELYREDGPAIENPNGEWWVNGKRINKKCKKTKRKLRINRL